MRIVHLSDIHFWRYAFNPLRLMSKRLTGMVALVAGRASVAARGGALLADALAGGPHAALAEVLRLRDSSGSVLDHLRVAGADTISLG